MHLENYVMDMGVPNTSVHIQILFIGQMSDEPENQRLTVNTTEIIRDFVPVLIHMLEIFSRQTNELQTCIM